MVVKRKVSLAGSASADPSKGAAAPTSSEVLELFFNTGIVHHEVALPPSLPDVVSSFVVMKSDGLGRDGISVRRAKAGEEPDVEISALEHLGELSHRWLPVPYQLSCPYTVQIFLVPSSGEDGRMLRAVLAIDTLMLPDSKSRHLDAALDEGRPFRPLDRDESVGFLDQPDTRELLRRMEKSGVERAAFKLAALYETLAPLLPRIRFSRAELSAPVPVSLVLDLGNSRSSAVLVEAREKGVFAIPLELRRASNPLSIADDTFDSRLTFLPSPFDKTAFDVAVGDRFSVPSIAKLGREALDRALETPHRFPCTLSSPKRYLWDASPASDKWYFAVKQQDEYRPVSGRLLKYIVEESGGLELRQDGPSAPPNPKYPARTMMLFAIAEIVAQAFNQINSVTYRKHQGRENNPRVLKHLVLTYPSGMREEEKQIYDTLIRNAVALVSYLYNIPEANRPNWNAQGYYDPFLFVDEALACQMVYIYQEVQYTFGGLMEDFVKVYGRKEGTVRVASIDIGGGTSDVMIAEYSDKLTGTGTSLSITRLFQDGVSLAGDEVCRALVEDIVFSQLLSQMPSVSVREKLVHLFAEGDGGHGAAWRTLKAKLVPYLWLPLARCFWSIAEGFEIPEHSKDKTYSLEDLFSIFESSSWSEQVILEADRFVQTIAPDFPGFMNIVFRFDRQEVERSILGVLREPLRRYADILAQFDCDLLVLAGRTSALECIRELFIAEMPVSPPRIKSMARYRVGDWYPPRWQQHGYIKDPKSTVTAGAAVLHLASRNMITGFLLDGISPIQQAPIYGIYSDAEPHIARSNELFRNGKVSPPFVYTAGMAIGFRNVDSQEMDGSPLFEVRPATAEVENALLEDRVSLAFELKKDGRILIADVKSQRDVFHFGVEDFKLRLKTVTTDRYWLDTGVLKNLGRYL
jgi:hypothetical protein